LDIIKNHFLKPFMNKQKGNVGVELEFPLINMEKKPVSLTVAQNLLDSFLEKGFKAEETTIDGKNAFISNDAGDVLSFDNSYNNFEFSMNYGPSLCDIAERFCRYFTHANSFALKHNHILTGMGTNPYKKYTLQHHVNFPVYNMVDEYLHTFPAKHNFPDFPAYLSSVQTHLDLPLGELPFAATVVARLDFIRAMLFSNSPSWDRGDKTLCYRDYLWEASAFPDTNTGKVDEEYKTTGDIISSFKKRKMFNCIRNGKYKVFAPVALPEYFNGDNDEDIKYFLSFRNIEITARGTLEVRSDCAQPVSDAFAPSAFSLGILYNLNEANDLLSGLFAGRSVRELRNTVIYGGELPVNNNILSEFVEIARRGLVLRQKGEEKLLEPLFERAEKKLCPAKSTLLRLNKGENIENIIKDYSQA
jgi:glutamate--cysteine ligase